MIGTPTIQALEKYLELVTARHELIVGNMANVDTPGYQTHDLDFRSELRRAMADQSGTARPASRVVPGLLERPDGNNVNLDRESIMLAETQIQFQIGVQLVNSEFHRLLTAIHEGK